MTEILILDIETTNFLDKGGKIVEIGMCALDLDTGNIRKLFDEVMHERPITVDEVMNSWIVNNSDLTVADIRHSRQLLEYKPSIQSIIDEFPLGATAFNNVFDFGFMEDRGFFFPKKLHCPMVLSCEVMRLPPTARMKKYRPDIKYKNPNVQQAWDYFFGKTGYVEKHRGYDDAEHEALIVYELYKRGVFKID